MKFAVVEYSSKTGTVWKHTDARPNYLCDPQREIDPTSFGCYVSALAGEHIPINGLVVGPVEPVSFLVKVYRKAMKRLTGRWPAYSLEYLAGFDVLMIVHQLSDAHEVVACIKRLKQQFPNTFVIGVPTQPFGILKSSIEYNPQTQHDFKEYLAACDIFLTVVKETLPWYATLTSTPVVYMPQPYPVHFAEQFFTARAQKEKTILVAGVTQRDNIQKGQVVAREVQKRFPEYTILVPKVHDLNYDEAALEGAKYQVLPFEEWREHLPTLAKTMLVINTDYTLTRGRVQTDCAAVGTPSVGANSDGQVDLFPELISAPDTSVEALVAQCAKLLTSPEYYQRIAHAAHEKLQKYSYAESADRLRLLVKTYAK